MSSIFLSRAHIRAKFPRIYPGLSFFFSPHVYRCFLSLSLSRSPASFRVRVVSSLLPRAEIPLGSRSFGPAQHHQVNALVTNAPCSSVHKARTCDCPSRERVRDLAPRTRTGAQSRASGQMPERGQAFSSSTRVISGNRTRSRSKNSGGIIAIRDGSSEIYGFMDSGSRLGRASLPSTATSVSEAQFTILNT